MLTVRNRGRRTTTFYVAVGFDERKKLKQLDARLHAARRLALRPQGSCGTHCSSARSPVPASASGVGHVRVVAQVPLGVQRRLAAGPAAVTAWR